MNERSNTNVRFHPLPKGRAFPAPESYNSNNGSFEWIIPMADITKTRMNAAEFFELPEQPGYPIVELIDGELILTPSRFTQHQRVLGRIMKLVHDLIPNGEVLPIPLDVHLDEFNVLEPDIMWISDTNSEIVTEQRIVGAPDLTIEIFSADTLKRDKTKKFELYEKHGVLEYWMIDPEVDQVEVWTRDDSGFIRLGVFGKTATFTSPALGKFVDLTPVFA